MNELRLKLQNFQSISSGELLFSTGTNVIIGQSNSGKSATFRGLKACLINPAGSQRFIKKGTKEASVTLEYNGNQIEWKRTAKESSYEINGETYLKTGRSNSFKIIDDTGFVCDSNDVIMNIEEELQLPFPFGISKSELFKLYEDVFCVSDSSIILKSAKEKEDEVKRDIVFTENELEKNKVKLDSIKQFQKEVDISELENAKSKLILKRDRLNLLSDGLSTIKRAALVDKITIPEKEFPDLLKEHKSLLKVKKTSENLKKLHSLSKKLKDCREPEYIDMGLYKSLKKLKETAIKLKEIGSLELPEQTFNNKLFVYHELQDYVSELKRIKTKIKINLEKLRSIQATIKATEEDV